MNSPQQNQNAELNIVHEFNAPKKLVFNAFSNANALSEWWGPAECEMTVIKLDFRPGGMFHYKMDYQGKINYGRMIFQKIQPHDLLEITNAFADENANPIKAPFDIELPIEIFYRFVFTESNGTTTITMTGTPVDPTQKQLEGFHSIDSSMREGFGATFNQLSLYLEKIHLNPNN